MNPSVLTRIGLALVALVAAALPARAHWLTQTLPLTAGWNAVYLHVDASHATLDSLVGNDPSNPIQEIWMWSPNPSSAQFVSSPQTPSQPVHWLNWVRPPATSGSLARLSGNVACLVRTTTDYTWNLKGKAVTPSYVWTSSGLNFIGFPTPAGGTAPTFDAFFAGAPELRVGAEVFAYRGGSLSGNPQQIFDLTSTRVTRGQAYWMRAAQFNRYFGPFEVTFQGADGARFGDSAGQVSFRLRNVTAQPLTVTLMQVASETAPTGQPVVRGVAPVLVRGELNPSTLTFQHAALASGPKQWTLAKSGEPGSDIEVVLGVDRQHMTGSPGDLYASLLRFTDSLNLTRVDVPASALVGSTAGLWVGGASVSSVNHYLKPYAKAADLPALTNLLTRLGRAEGTNGFHYELDATTGHVLVFGGPANLKGSYLLDGPINTDEGTVARPYPLRLIIHHDGTTARLLQKVHYGVGLSGSAILATREELLKPSQLASARRISAVHLPTSEANTPWAFTGSLAAGASLSVTVDTAYDDQSSNPFLHTYHPDHDNLDAEFRTPLSVGLESYGIRRQITLTLTAPPSDFDGLTRGSASLNGTYVERVTLLGAGTPSRQFDVRGTFVLNRISDIATLSTP